MPDSPFGPVELSEPVKSDAEKKGWTREEAIAYGKALGTEEARRRHESADWAESRIKRAMAYAAWEYDGKLIGQGSRYRKEFGIPEPAMSDPRVSLGSDFVEKRK